MEDIMMNIIKDDISNQIRVLDDELLKKENFKTREEWKKLSIVKEGEVDEDC